MESIYKNVYRTMPNIAILAFKNAWVYKSQTKEMPSALTLD